MDLYEIVRQLPGEDGFSGLPVDKTWVRVRDYPALQDGQSCTVYAMRMPAVFWRIEAKDIEVTTGSGMADLVDQLASAIQTGMIAIRHGSASEAAPTGRML